MADPVPPASAFDKFLDSAVVQILIVDNGLSYLCLLIAAVLLSIVVVQKKLPNSIAVLVGMFLVVSLLTSLAPMARAIWWSDSLPVEVVVRKTSHQKLIQKFPIFLEYNNNTKDITAEDFKKRLGSGENYFLVNISEAAAILNDSFRIINESNNKIEILQNIICRNGVNTDIVDCASERGIRQVGGNPDEISG